MTTSSDQRATPAGGPNFQEAAAGVRKTTALVRRTPMPPALRDQLIAGLRETEARARRRDLVGSIANLEATVATLDAASGLDLGWKPAQAVWESALVGVKAPLLPCVWDDFEARTRRLQEIAGCHDWTERYSLETLHYERREGALVGMNQVLAEIAQAPITTPLKRDLSAQVRTIGRQWDQKTPDFEQFSLDVQDTCEYLTSIEGTQIPKLTSGRIKQGLIVGPLAAGPAAFAPCVLPVIGEVLLVFQVIAVVVIVGGIAITLLFKSSKAKRAFASIKKQLGDKPTKDILDKELKDLSADEKKEVKDALNKTAEELKGQGATAGGDLPQDKQYDQVKEAAASIPDYTAPAPRRARTVSLTRDRADYSLPSHTS